MHNGKTRKTRISNRVKEAIRLMVEESRKRFEAAELVGLKDNSLWKALRRPEVSAYRNMLLRVLRESEASRAVAVGARLMDSASSESVRADMTKWIAGVGGIAPVQHTESRVLHEHYNSPGLTVVFTQREQPQLSEGKVIEQRRSLEASGRPRVPHPSESEEDQ